MELTLTDGYQQLLEHISDAYTQSRRVDKRSASTEAYAKEAQA